MPDQIDLSQMESVPVQKGSFLRLRRYWKPPNQDFWDHIWHRADVEGYFSYALKGSIAPLYLRWISRYLGRGKLLEAGCGLGHVVLALRFHGYDCWGLDFATRTIDFLNSRFPNVPFVEGDIRHLPMPDGSFDGYLSFGVIEHFTEGQDLILAEAARVVRPGGLILLSVPALNTYRKLRVKLRTYRKAATYHFFEDCYSYEEVKYLLSSSGFEYLNHAYLNTVMTFMQETPLRPLYRYVEDTRHLRSVVDRFLTLVLPRSWFGHMLILAARRKF